MYSYRRPFACINALLLFGNQRNRQQLMDKRANFLSLILLDALEDGSESDIETILSRNNVDASYVPPERGIAPIHYTCGMENEQMALQITRRFLANGADPNVRTFEQMTPLHVAAMYGRVEIVKLLLQHGAECCVEDDERKQPLHYAIEECHFDVVQAMCHHIDQCKQKEKQQKKSHAERQAKASSPQQRIQLEEEKRPPPPPPPPPPREQQQEQQTSLLSQSHFDRSVQQRVTNRLTSTPQQAAEKNLRVVLQRSEDAADSKTPSGLKYNYDVSSPYYIYVTHRRHQAQPEFPQPPAAGGVEGAPTLPPPTAQEEEKEQQQEDPTPVVNETRPVNIFSLTRKNVEELSLSTSGAERSRGSLIELWRDKVQRSRKRSSMIREYDDVGKLIDHMVADRHMNFNNTVLREKPATTKEAAAKEKPDDCDSGACGSTSTGPSSLTAPLEETVYRQLPAQAPTAVRHAPRKSEHVSLGGLIQRMARRAVGDESSPEAAAAQPATTDTSFHTATEGRQVHLQVPAPTMMSDAEVNWSREPTNFIRSPSNEEFFMQMTEAYVHTDDENGLVFYETKLLSNQGHNLAKLKSPGGSAAHDATLTTQSTEVTLPADYDTDALRAELTTFGMPPGPITKTTKRMYIKRLIKCKRKTKQMLQEDQRLGGETTKYSVELHRTVRSPEVFERIGDYMELERLSAQYFANNTERREMREGHLKQSFIYMLIDPRISCNLPSESVYLDKFTVWRRFLQSIFYVGKGKTSRPYSHLYDAMKAHSRQHAAMQQAQAAEAGTQNGAARQGTDKTYSIRKQRLNMDIFKSPPPHTTASKKLDRILDIWAHSSGVVCLHVYHNIVPSDAYTREAAIIEAFSLRHLTNAKRGDYYGPARSWMMREKKHFGIALLYKAMQMYLAEGESQLSPSDLI